MYYYASEFTSDICFYCIYVKDKLLFSAYATKVQRLVCQVRK